MSVDSFLLSADTTDLNYPEIRPTLDLNFARSKTLDPRITFTRASGGSYVGADGLIKYASLNQPRFDHDPITGESLGLLVEESRTNGSINSENASTWSNIGGQPAITQQNVEIAPDGTFSADNIYAPSGFWLGRSLFGSTLIVPNNQFLIMSVFAKKDPLSKFRFLNLNIDFVGSGNRIHFDLTTGELIGVFPFPSGNNINGYSEKLSNGWYRFVAYHQNTTGSTQTWSNGNTLRVFPFVTSNNVLGVGEATGSSTDGVYVWGRQTEVSTFPRATSYIPTVGSTRTRAADDVRIIGNEFLNIFNENEGTFFSKSKTSGQGSDAFFVGDVNTQPISQNYIDILRYQDNILRAGISLVGSNGTSVVINSNLPSSKVYKASHAYNLNRSVLYVDGNLIGRVNSRTRIVPKDLKVLQIGKHRDGFYLNGHIYRLTYFNRLLQDSQLQALTR